MWEREWGGIMLSWVESKWKTGESETGGGLWIFELGVDCGCVEDGESKVGREMSGISLRLEL